MRAVGDRGRDVAVDERVTDEDALARWWSPNVLRLGQRPSFTGYPFTLGVASGEPVSSGVVLWTRLAPEPLSGGGVGADPVAVDWEVAEDESIRTRRAARDGRCAGGVGAQCPRGGRRVLSPRAGTSIGSWRPTRSVPSGARGPRPRLAELPQQLRFGLGSCQHFEVGYYAAHRHLKAEDLDLMVFVGDYIYEGPGRAGNVRRHVGGEARTLADYRNRHAQYKTDPDLQRLHAAVPWLVTWDDHEVDNNYAGARSESLDPEFRRRRAAAYRAYFEHMPLRQRARPSRVWNGAALSLRLGAACAPACARRAPAPHAAGLPATRARRCGAYRRTLP